MLFSNRWRRAYLQVAYAVRILPCTILRQDCADNKVSCLDVPYLTVLRAKLKMSQGKICLACLCLLHLIGKSILHVICLTEKMPANMQSIRQMLKSCRSAAESGTCFVEEFVNLLSPTVKSGSYLLLWSPHQPSTERMHCLLPLEIKAVIKPSPDRLHK